MGVPLLYRVSSGLLVLFALGHHFGFRRVDPRWGADAVVAAMRGTRFEVQGQIWQRTECLDRPFVGR